MEQLPVEQYPALPNIYASFARAPSRRSRVVPREQVLGLALEPLQLPRPVRCSAAAGQRVLNRQTRKKERLPRTRWAGDIIKPLYFQHLNGRNAVAIDL